MKSMIRAVHKYAMVLVLVVLPAGLASAGFVPVNPSAPLPSAGESKLNAIPFGQAAGSSVQVDWMVFQAQSGIYAGNYIYMYQLENYTGFGTHSLATLTVEADPAFLIAAGVLVGDNLDVALNVGDLAHPGHNSTDFPSLSGAANDNDAFTFDSTPTWEPSVNLSDNVTWTTQSMADELPLNWQSITLWFVSPRPPVPGFGRVIDGTVYDVEIPGSQYLPVPLGSRSPVPEAASFAVWGVLGLMASVVGLSKKGRSRRKSA